MIASASWTPDLRSSIQRTARAAGFDLVGTVSAKPASETPARFSDWIVAGYAGEMDYLKRRDEEGVFLRSAVDAAIPWARSVLVCAMNYNAAAPRSIDPAPASTGWIARYAWSGKEVDGEIRPTDYHDDLLARLRTIEAALQEQALCQTRCYVDTGPILERDLATRAGLGWTGKNTCLLTQMHGSWLLLACIVTSLELPEAAAPLEAPDRCGSCTRCIDACPTDALIAPRQMDASLCIAYLTIEKKGSIPEPLRQPMGRQVFGCDICQDVCPWNSKAPLVSVLGLASRAELINPDLAWLAELTSAEFKQHFRGSPLERTGRKRLHRNVAIAMGNTGNRAFLPWLENWRVGDDPVLEEVATWAIAAIHRHRDQAAAPHGASASID